MSICGTTTFKSATTTATITRFQCEFTWTIPNLRSRCGESTITMKSLQFSADVNTCKLFLELTTPTIFDDCDMLDLSLDAADLDELNKYGTIRGEYECSIMNSEGQEVKKQSGCLFISLDSHYFRFERLSCFLTDIPEGETRIHCLISYIHELDYAAIRDQCETLSLSKSHTFDGFEKLLYDEKFSDVTVYVGSKKFLCHKSILAARSSVFEAMLTHDMKEKTLNRIDINDTDENIFQEVLRYIYTGKVEDIETMAFELLLAADKYDLPILITICENELRKTLNHETVVKVLSISNTLDLTVLKSQAIKYIQTNLKKMIGSSAWTDLTSRIDLMKIVLEAYGK